MRGNRFYEQLEAWDREGEHRFVIGVIEALNEKERDLGHPP